MGTEFNTQVGNGEYRLQFETDNREYYLLIQSTARRFVGGGHMTNANRIRSMSDEELAETMNQKAIDTICDIVCGGECNALATLHKTSNQVCKEIILDWLRQPYKGEGNIEISEG